MEAKQERELKILKGYFESQGREVHVVDGEVHLGSLTDEAKQRYIRILQDPLLFKKITEQELSKKIVGEESTCKVIFLCAQGRLVKNSQIASYNLLVNDEAGTGKDYVTSNTLDILPKDVYIRKTRISPTVFTYWHNSTYEPDWTWNGKVFYPEDISETVLNSDVFKVMCSSGSSATITVRNRAVDIEINGKPVIITTTATATPNPELTRRFAILNLDSSQEQTRKIMRRHSEYKQIGVVAEYDPEITEAMKLLTPVKVIVPYAKIIDEYFPETNVIMRTNYPRFLDFISASAAFHQYQREKDKNGFVIAQGEDYEIARECFIKLCSNKYMIPLTILQKQILSIFEKSPSIRVSASQFHGLHNIMSLKSVIFNFGILAKYGILQSETDKDSYGRDLEVYSLSKSYNPNEKLEIPHFKDIGQNEKVSKACKVGITSKISKVSNELRDDLHALHVNPKIDFSNSGIKESIEGDEND